MRQSKDSSDGSSKSGINGWFVNNWRSLTVLLSIFAVALILRVFFAYGTSAGSGFALSGGSDAAYHLRVIEHIVSTGTHIVTDPLLNYPFGGLNYSPPLFDWAIAIVAYPLTLLGYSAADASSIALVYSTAVVGAFTCIPVYFLGKEMFSRKAGYIAAAFFAISSLAIVKTVFSNGTESAFFVLFFVLTTLFILRAVKAYKLTEEDNPSLLSPFKNKAVLKNLLFAGLSLLALQLSWIGFLVVIMIICLIMAVQAVIDRFRGKSAVGYVSMYASVMLFATLISSLYYAVGMGMTMVSVGPLCLILLAAVISFLVSTYRVWVISIPVSIAIFAVFMAAAYYFMPSLFAAMTSGANPYAQGIFGSLLVSTQSVALSSQAVYAGMVTMWFSVGLVAYMLFRLPKNTGSPKYLFIVTWFLALLYISWKNVDLALLAAPMYAIGAGVVIVALLKRADLKTYAEGFKGATITSVWKRILKPIPLLTVLGTVFILLMPNVLYAVDASIPSNDKGDYNAELSGTLGGMGSGGVSYLGATNFYIRDDDWTLSTAWDHFSGTDPGSLVTWLDYGMEAAAKGGFSVVSDSFGNGYSAASNILLGTPSGAITAMTVRLIQYEGKIPQDMRDAMGHDEAADLELILFDGMYSLSDPGATDRIIVNTVDYVRSNPDVFGATNFNITEENAMYLAAAYFMTSNFTDGRIAEFYDILRSETGRSIDYIGVTGNMVPLYYGDGNVFSTMAYLNSYHLDRNGSPTKYYTAGVPYFGYYYTYNDAMYDTMIWKALIGPSLYDYRLMVNNANLSYAEMVSGLMFSDGTIKAYPGYGLGNFYVDDAEWWVTYSPRDGDGNPMGDWTLMLASEAQAKQAVKYNADTDPEAGGFINYFGGMAFLKYDGSGDVYSGTVITDSVPTGETDEVRVSGLTVAVFDADGNLLGKTITNSEGDYSLMISDKVGIPEEFKIYSGPVYSMEIRVDNIASLVGYTEIALSYVTGILTPDLGEDITIELNGWISGGSYTIETYVNSSGEREFEADVIPDIYSVSMTIGGVQVYTGAFTLYPGNINVGEIDIKSVSIEITILDSNGMPVMISDGDIDIVSTDGSVLTTEADGNIAKTKAAPGAYTVLLAGNEFNGAPYILVPNTSNTLTTANTASFTATLNSVSRLTLRMVEAAEIIVENTDAGDVITLTNGAYAVRGTYTATVVATGATASIFVPVGDYGKASAYTATITSVSGETSASVYAKVDGTTNVVDKNTAIAGNVEVIINMEFDGDAMGGVVAFIDADMMIITVSISDSGETTVMLPEGDYTLYAYARETVARDSKAYLGSVTIELQDPVTDPQEVKIELVSATFVSGRVQYTGPSTGTAATSTLGVSFAPVFVKDGDNIVMTSTDSLGNYSIVLPRKIYSQVANTETVFGSFMRPTGNLPASGTTPTGDTATWNITVNLVTGEGSTKLLDPAAVMADETVYVDISGASGVEVKIDYKLTGEITMTVYNYNRYATYVAVLSDGVMPIPLTGTGVTVTNEGVIISLTQVSSSATSTSRVYTLTYTGTPTLDMYVAAAASNARLGVDVTYPSGSDITVTDGSTAADPVKYTLTSSVTGPGTVEWSADGTTYAALTAAITVQNGATVYLKALPDTETGDESFYSWTGDLAGDSSTATLLMDGNKTIGAVFFEDTTPGTTSYTLSSTFPVSGGTIQWSADGVAYAELAASVVVPADETIYLRAMPDAGNAFDEWDTTDLTSTSQYETLLMDADKAIEAVFSAITTFTVTGTVYDDAGVELAGVTVQYQLNGNTSVTFDTPATASDGIFTITVVSGDSLIITGLTLDGYFITDATPPQVPENVGTVTSDVFGLVFELEPFGVPLFTLTSSVTGSGKIQWSLDGITYLDLPASASVPEDATVYLRAVPYTGNAFHAWSGDLESYNVDAQMEMDDNKAIAVTFFASSVLKYNLTTRSYNLLIEPADPTPGNTGYYYSGKMRIFAGQTAFDATPFVVPVTVITFDVDAGDKVSFIGGQVFSSSSSTDTEKIYYVLTEDWDTCVLIIENDDQIAYISLAEAGADIGPIAVSDYTGDKASISGYVGVTANGTMEITMSATVGGSAYEVTVEVPIINGTYEAVLPVDMGGEAITYDLVPSMELTSGGIEYVFELWNPTALTFTSIEDGQTINMEMALTTVTPPADQDVEIENVVMTYSADGIASGTFDVTNNTAATIVLRGGTGWTSIDFGGSKSYILIDPGATAQPVSFTATYDPTRTGDGNADLSVIALDVKGSALLTQSVGTEPPVDMSSDPIADWGSFTNGPNRVSKNEYGFGITLTNDGPQRISVDISVPDLTPYIDNNWYVSIVDAGNLIIDPSLSDIVKEFVINGNSTATFYLRLIWTGEGDPSLIGLPLELVVNGETIELDSEPTNINTPKMSATGNNIFDSMNGIPNIVWVLIALSILAALLIVWLGIRRGVFSRRR